MALGLAQRGDIFRVVVPVSSVAVRAHLLVGEI